MRRSRGDKALVKKGCKRTGRNVSEARASLEMEIVGVELFRKQRRPLSWIRATNGIYLPTGVMGAARTQAFSGDMGDLLGMQDKLQTVSETVAEQESEGLIVPVKSVNADGGKGPWFRVRLGKPRIWRST